VNQTSRAQQILRSVAANPVKALFLGVIRLYQVAISPGIPSRCKYYPSCSQYALDAVREYGAFRGFILGAWRVLRCNPLSYGGYDPVSGQKLFRRRRAESLSCCDPASHSPLRPACDQPHEVRA
jgi:putative membrane protein insertion efficiency factor